MNSECTSLIQCTISAAFFWSVDFSSFRVNSTELHECQPKRIDQPADLETKIDCVKIVSLKTSGKFHVIAIKQQKSRLFRIKINLKTFSLLYEVRFIVASPQQRVQVCRGRFRRWGHKLAYTLSDITMPTKLHATHLLRIFGNRNVEISTKWRV